MKVTIEISNNHLNEILPFLTRQSAGHIKIAKKSIEQSLQEVIDEQLFQGYDLSASALEKYLREMKSEYIRLKENEKGGKLEREHFIALLDEKR